MIKLILTIVFVLNVINYVLNDNSIEYSDKENIPLNSKKSLNSKCKREVCVLTPEQSEGPFFIPEQSVRRDLREDIKGLTLNLKINIIDANTCEPLTNVAIDFWSCTPEGKYSGYEDFWEKLTKNSGPKIREHVDPVGNTTFLRGIQLTNKYGQAEFLTIFPGWYGTRTTHMHLECHINGTHVHVGQLFFKEEITAKVEKIWPYTTNVFKRSKNEEDIRFVGQNGDKMIVNTYLSENSIQLELFGEITLSINSKHIHNSSEFKNNSSDHKFYNKNNSSNHTFFNSKWALISLFLISSLISIIFSQ